MQFALITKLCFNFMFVFLYLALDSGNVLPKKQVFEMLAVICVYGNRGYGIVLDALQHFKVYQQMLLTVICLSNLFVPLYCCSITEVAFSSNHWLIRLWLDNYVYYS